MKQRDEYTGVTYHKGAPYPRIEILGEDDQGTFCHQIGHTKSQVWRHKKDIGWFMYGERAEIRPEGEL